MNDRPNQVSAERFRELKSLLGGKQTPDEAKSILRALAGDPDTPPIIRINIPITLLELAGGRSVQSAMARLRRASGLDKAK